MRKANELSMLILELEKCGETLIGISDRLADMLGNEQKEETPVKTTEPREKTDDEPKTETPPKAEKPLTLENVRAVLAEKSRLGFTAEVRALLEKYGADRLSAVNPEEYPSLMKEAEVIGNAE